jgi:predicted lipoprotein with Yx(FWY)xxD motif
VRTKLATCLVAGTLLMAAACGSDDDNSTSAGDAPAGQASDQGSGDAPVTTGETDLGEVLTTADGMTIYGFTNDADGTSTCEGGCADSWPPVLVDGDTLPAGLDADVFSVIERSDETYQLKAGDWPLYTFAGDSASGDTNGQGTGGVWFVATPDGELQRDAAGSSDTTADSPGGY